jgi:hypothetical protein
MAGAVLNGMTLLPGDFRKSSTRQARGWLSQGAFRPFQLIKPLATFCLRVDIAQEGRDLYKTRTDGRGNFKIDGLDYNGFFSAEFTLPSETRTRGFRMRLDGAETPKIFDFS